MTTAGWGGALALVVAMQGCSAATDMADSDGSTRGSLPRADPKTPEADAVEGTPPIGSQPVAGPAMGSPATPTAGVGAAGGPADEGGPGQGPEDSATCGMVEITPVVMFSPGNLLVIFDRSSSMSTLFDATTGTTRLDNARHAINTALSPLACVDTTANPDGETCADTLSVALLTFPTAGGDAGGLAGIGTSCSVDDLSSTEQLPWQGVTPFVAAFDPYWTTHALVRGTPISVAFARADEALMDPAVIGNKAVLFLTDGEETGNCQGGVDVVAQTQAWNAMGINTHVVSLAGGLGDFGQAFNDRVAAAGGTGQSINPTSSDQLTDEITKIVFSSRGTTTCEITIEDAKLTNLDEACERGDVFVQSSKVPCDQVERTEGFFVKDDKTIEIVGSYCQLLEDTMSLRAMFPCEILGPA